LPVAGAFVFQVPVFSTLGQKLARKNVKFSGIIP
jgi:hypothetical protein